MVYRWILGLTIQWSNLGSTDSSQDVCQCVHCTIIPCALIDEATAKPNLVQHLFSVPWLGLLLFSRLSRIVSSCRTPGKPASKPSETRSVVRSLPEFCLALNELYCGMYGISFLA